MNVIKRFVAISAFAFAAIAPSHAQQPTTASQFVVTAAALANGPNPLRDLEFNGTVTHTAGSTNETGSFRLLANNTGRARMDFTYGSSSREEFYSGYSEFPDCAWSDGTHQVSIADHNCQVTGVYFSPLLLATAYAAGVDFSILLASDANGAAVLSISRVIKNADNSTTSLLQKAGKASIVFDKTTYLPTSYKFQVHPDRDAQIDIPVEIRFSDYRQQQGAMVPFHIQKYLNGTLELDLIVSSVSLNNGTTISK